MPEVVASEPRAHEGQCWTHMVRWKVNPMDSLKRLQRLMQTAGTPEESRESALRGSYDVHLRGALEGRGPKDEPPHHVCPRKPTKESCAHYALILLRTVAPGNDLMRIFTSPTQT